MIPRHTLALLAATVIACSGETGTGFDETQTTPTPIPPTQTQAPQATPTEGQSPTQPGEGTPTAAETTPTDGSATATLTPDTPTAGSTPTAGNTPTQAGDTATPETTPTAPPTPTATAGPTATAEISDTPTASPTQEGTPVPEGDLIVSDQIVSAPSEVNIIAVKALVDGFVVIHEDDGSGEAPGPAIGHAFVAAGSVEDLAVTLDHTIGNGEVFHAMLHEDGGEAGVYTSVSDDPPATDASGEIIVKPFRAWNLQGSPQTIVVFEQVAQPTDQVLIAAAVVDGDAWVVIHEDEGSAPGEVIGFAPLLAGTSRDIPVTLFRDVTEQEILHAMLHSDTGETGNYEFPDADPPITDGEGHTIVEAFTVFPGTASADGPLVVSSQAPGSDTAIADSVAVDAASWLVVFEDGGDGPGDQLGFAAVSAGTHVDVEVSLSRTLNDGESIVFELFVDAGQVGVMEIPDPDLPLEDEFGGPISELARVGDGGTGPGGGGSRLEVENQKAGDTTAIVNLVSVEDDAWLVVHEDNGGDMGAIIGHTLVEEGHDGEVQLSLDRAMALGEFLIFALYTDKGDPGVFEVPGADELLTQDDGAGLFTAVAVTETGGGLPGGSEAPLEIEDQPAGVQSIFVRRVDTPEPAFLVIREDDNGPGDVLGFTTVSAGPTEDFFVNLTRVTTEGETLHGGLLIDSNTNGVVDLGVDQPVLNGEDAVEVTFQCSGSPNPPSED